MALSTPGQFLDSDHYLPRPSAINFYFILFLTGPLTHLCLDLWVS